MTLLIGLIEKEEGDGEEGRVRKKEEELFGDSMLMNIV